MRVEGHIVRRRCRTVCPAWHRQRGRFRAVWERDLQRQMIEEFPATGESGGTGNRNE